MRELVAATGAALEARQAAEADRQLALLAPTRLDGERAAKQRRKIESDVARARGVGRPKGAENLATREIKAFLRSHGYDPVVARWRWLLHTPETLALELGCTKLEAFDRLDRIHAELRKLYYAEAPVLDDEGKPLPAFQLTIGGQNVAVQVNADGSKARIAPWETDPEVKANSQRNQPLTIEAGAKSQSAKSQADE